MDDGFLATSALKGRNFQVSGTNLPCCLGQEFLIMDGLCHDFEVPMVEIRSASQLLFFTGMDWDGYLDVCCGIGGMSFGAQFLNLSPRSAIDHSLLVCRAFARNHQCPVILGDISNNLDVARLIEQSGCKRLGMTCGFPCPPFSSMGDQKGFKDRRAHTFYDVLNLGYMSGSLYIMLECTPHNGRWYEIQNTLNQFAEAMGMQKIEGILQLHQAWPCHRRRWWCLLLPLENLDKQTRILDLPHFADLQTLKSIIPIWPAWTKLEEESLTWTSAEHEFFLSLTTPDQFLLNLNRRSPTLLHSMGHHLTACPCGCRDTGLSPTRLAKDGLALVAHPSSFISGSFRHLHPAEAALLNTVPVDYSYDHSELKNDLPLLGQIAAPLQVIWVLRQALGHMQEAGLYRWEACQKHPIDLLRNYIAHNMQLREQLWPTFMTQSIQEINLDMGNITLHFRVGPNTTVAQLVHAERQLRGWGHRVKLLREGHLQLPHAYLRAGTYQVISCLPTQVAAQPTGSIQIHIEQHDVTHVACVQAGTLVQEVLSPFHIDYKPGIRLSTSSADFTWGDRLWTSAKATLRGSGPFPGDGISFSDVYTELEDLIDMLPSWQKEEVWLPSFFLLQELIRRPQQLALQLLRRELPKKAPRWIIAPMLSLQHWALLIYDLRTGVPTYFDGVPGHLANVACDLTFLFANVFSVVLHRLIEKNPIIQPNNDHCAAILRHNFGLHFGLWKSMDFEDIKCWHNAMLHQESLRGRGVADQTATLQWLTDFLQTKGVPEDQAEPRAQQALKRLGLGSLMKAINTPNPWRALKQLAGANGKPFQWVEYQELQTHIEKRAKEKHGAQAPKGQKGRKHKPAQPPLQNLAPSQLQIVPGTFVDANKKPLEALTVEAISPEARGLVIVNVEQAKRFIQDGKKISIDALALLTTVEIPAAHQGSMEIQNMTWPGLLLDTKDPILIRGSCVQLGDIKVTKVLGSPLPTASFDPDLLRIMVYKDEWPHDWAIFKKGPLKAIVTRFDQFQLCDGANCGNGKNCPRFHPSVEEEVELVILDAFGWRWMSEGGALANVNQASSFSVMIRVPPSATSAILALSSTDGAYFELRDPHGRGPHSKYAVVWIKGNFQAAQHLKCQSTKILHVIRFHNKFGLRILAADHEQVHQMIHPKTPFVPGGTSLLFEVGPFPYGIAKHTILTAVKSIGWMARPLKPTKGNNSGRFWMLGADTEPASPILQFGDDTLTITKITEAPTPKEPLNVVASMRTLQRINTAKPQIDPLQKNDPWANFNTSLAASSTQPPRPSRIEEVTDQIKQSVEAQVREQLASFQFPEPSGMAVDQDDRVTNMEFQLQEIQVQNQKFGEWFAEAGDRVTGIFNQVQRQESQIEALNTQMQINTAHTEQLHQQFGGLRVELRQDLDQGFKKQQEILESLLSKKMRTEWLDRRGAHSRCSWRLNVISIFRYIWLLILLLCTHVGEALHPGPHHYDFHLGAINPSGINKKALAFSELPSGIWTISETQATESCFQRFQRDLRWQDRSLQIKHGTFAPPRPQSQDSGSWTGVAHMAKCTIRPLNIVWQGNEFQSGRTLVSSFHWGHLCVVGAAIYGPPVGPTHRSARSTTEALLSTISQEIVINSTGPRFVAGDFNCDDFDLNTFSLWRSLGWQEIQRIAETRWQIPRRPTSKGKTIRDMVWVSPELAQWLINVVVDDEVFADHAVLAGQFRVPANPLWTSHWWTPASLDWTLISVPDWHDASAQSFTWNREDPTASFTAWSKQVEQEISRYTKDGQPLRPQTLGRGQTTKVALRPLTHVPLGRGRHGDVQPRSSFLNRVTHLWFRQLRRLQAYCQRAESSSRQLAVAIDQMHTWSSIRRATGFSMSFSLWWAIRPMKMQGAPTAFPELPPTAIMARRIFDDFQLNYKHFESFQFAQRRKLIQAKHQHYNQLLFHQLKAEEKQPLDHLVLTQSYEIQSIDSSLEVQLDRTPATLPGLTWTLLPGAGSNSAPQWLQGSHRLWSTATSRAMSQIPSGSGRS